MLNLRSKHSIFVPNVAIFILERNLIGADFDHVLGNHFWALSACHAINKTTLYIVIFAELHLKTWLPLSLKAYLSFSKSFSFSDLWKILRFLGGSKRETLIARRRKYCEQKSVKFGGRIVSLRSGRASSEDARDRLVSLEGFSFVFRAKHEEWCEWQLVSRSLNWMAKRIGSTPIDQDNQVCMRFSCVYRKSKFDYFVLKWLRRKILNENWPKLVWILNW